ncbi:MAG: hypothetical protein LBK95_07730 [Bifidobacteriaceae bacterium]|jgi:hypothetical protein|nr:hypothetical protein [Bifidobacteriaceae bacterium]
MSAFSIYFIGFAPDDPSGDAGHTIASMIVALGAFLACFVVPRLWSKTKALFAAPKRGRRLAPTARD